MIVALTSQAEPPSVALDVSGLPAGTASLSVLRLVEASALSAVSVRGARGSVVGTTATLTDWDAPTGVPVVYRLTALGADGAILDTTDKVLPAIADDPLSRAWLSDPLDPTSAVRVTLLLGTDETRSYPADLSVTYPHGDGLGRAQVGQRRQPIYRLVMSAEGADAAAVSRLLTSALSLLWRPPSGLRLPPAVYGVTADVSESVWGQRWVADADTHWEIALTATRGPGRDVIRAGWTYGDVIALGLTYRRLFVAYGAPSGSFGAYRDLTREP